VFRISPAGAGMEREADFVFAQVSFSLDGLR
jgi:hypothetical protein